MRATFGCSQRIEVRLSMRLHSAPRSGNSYKVRLLLSLLGTSCETVNYDTKGGETHAPGFLKNINPDGKVPVLELEDGTMLPESGAILYYLAEGTSCLPEEKLEQAQVLRWMFFGKQFWINVLPASFSSQKQRLTLRAEAGTLSVDLSTEDSDERLELVRA
jgi:glutathione S-transferase